MLFIIRILISKIYFKKYCHATSPFFSMAVHSMSHYLIIVANLR